MKKLILLLLFIPLVSFSQQNIKTKFLLPKHHHPEELYERNYNDEYSIFLSKVEVPYWKDWAEYLLKTL